MRPSTAKSGAKPAGSKHAAGKPAAPSAHLSTAMKEKDDYIVNLKGSIYLLSIENEMLKKVHSGGSGGAATLGRSLGGGAGGGGGGGSAHHATPMPSAQHPSPTTASLLSSQLPSAEFPSEIGDAFEVMRQKYTQLEHKYQHDLEESRRGAEALASQCAAQSSLIATLKREVAQSASVLKDQKVIVQRVEAKSSADLELAQRDIAHLHARIVELQEEKRAGSARCEALGVALADAQAGAARAGSEAAASDSARASSLDAYARQLLASRYLLKAWRGELAQRRAAEALYDRMRGEKAAAEKRAARGEGEAARERAASAAASALARAQLEAAAEERAALVAAGEEAAAAASRTAAELATARANLRLLDDQLPDMANRLERGAGALARCETQLALTLARSAELERLLVAKGAEAEVLRGSAVAAEARQRSALSALRGVEKELAEANARAGALGSAEAEGARGAAALQAEVEALSQRAAVAASEVSSLRDELSRRPPIDIIKELDVENLMQRNMQAAAAMHQLLAWQSAHASQPLSSALRAEPN